MKNKDTVGKECNHLRFMKSVKVEDIKGNRGEMYYCTNCKKPIKIEAR